nr:retrovirus-related Pol polyprotein from transposon TNT 1-94 [Tanacetum cinerariifolium]GFB17684.1 retrovirus-related Pol polyprotein from transposon TNT 1-94 [Tanacetum cinerariifolium]
MFDEYFNPPPSVASLVPAVVAPDLIDSTGTPLSTITDQDVTSPSTSQTPQETQPAVIPSGVEEEFHDIKVAHLVNNTFFGVPIPKPNSEESSSRDVISNNESCIALNAFADADHDGCQDTRRSTSGSKQLLGDRLVSWSSKKQKSSAISSIKAEYIALL